jgi:hypothetical protein
MESINGRLQEIARNIEIVGADPVTRHGFTQVPNFILTNKELSAGEKPQWTGPFATIETACLSIARKLAIEIADRHTQSIERHGLTPDHPLYRLKPTTRLDAP